MEIKVFYVCTDIMEYMHETYVWSYEGWDGVEVYIGTQILLKKENSTF